VNEQRREFSSYVYGLVGSAGLTLLPFLMVANQMGDVALRISAITICAIAQVALQLWLFLHIDFSRQKREDLLLILFSVLILCLLIGGTIWIMSSLATRMH
jgi:cytochrome o ubiquinol oxidase operon protein cyoD